MNYRHPAYCLQPHQFERGVTVVQQDVQVELKLTTVDVKVQAGFEYLQRMSCLGSEPRHERNENMTWDSGTLVNLEGLQGEDVRNEVLCFRVV